VVGRKEHSIHIAHVASVSIDTNLLFSDVIIETSGGATPVTCHGHRKADAVRMKQLIEHHQTQYYRAPSRDARAQVPPQPSAKAGAVAPQPSAKADEVVRG
jgi:hypothetical protein